MFDTNPRKHRFRTRVCVVCIPICVCRCRGCRCVSAQVRGLVCLRHRSRRSVWAHTVIHTYEDTLR